MVEKLGKKIQAIKPYQAVLFGFMVFFAWLLVRNSWVGDDGFITMRVVDNLARGHGMVWNVGERVQVFTHPLWLLLITPFYLVYPEPYETLYLLSLVLSLGAIFIVFNRFTKTGKTLVITGMLLAASTAFIDFCSSGLENPLTNVLLVSAIGVALQPVISLKTLFYTSLLAALAAVTRLDTILFYIPIILYQLVILRKDWLKASGIILLGFVPFLAWGIFATLYFGFPLPNTYYAKIADTGLSYDWFTRRAAAYFMNSLRSDPITLGVISLNLVAVTCERQAKRISVAIGILLYLAYIYSIGGDFMSGRFFSAPFLAAAILLVTTDQRFLTSLVDKKLYYLLAASILFLGLSADHPPIFTRIDYDHNGVTDPASYADEELFYNNNYFLFDKYGIANERLYYFYTNGWYRYESNLTMHPWRVEGLLLKEAGEKFVIKRSVGMIGYYAGPQLYIMDEYALADPLRARLPAQSQARRIGHLEREIPAGYEQTLRNRNHNQIVDPDLRLYYEKLSILIHADVFAPGRLQEIIKFNLGYYDYLIARYNGRVLSR